jgi:predicted restriction endonuclease
MYENIKWYLGGIMPYLDEPEKPKSISKAEWVVIKASHGNKCVICGKTEKQVGILEQAHIKAQGKGGSQVLPMCATHHRMYDHNLLTVAQLRKIGLTKKSSARLTPRKKKKETYFDGSEVIK